MPLIVTVYSVCVVKRFKLLCKIVMILQGYRHSKRRALIQLLLALTPNKNEAIHATNRNGNKHETG